MARQAERRRGQPEQWVREERPVERMAVAWVEECERAVGVIFSRC